MLRVKTMVELREHKALADLNKKLEEGDEVLTRLAACLTVNDELITEKATRVKLREELQKIVAQAGTGNKMISIDAYLHTVVSMWQARQDARMEENAARLRKVFIETDEDGSGTCDFAEFKTCVEGLRPELAFDEVLDVFEEGIEFATGEHNEDTNCLTINAFVNVGQTHKLCRRSPLPSSTPSARQSRRSCSAARRTARGAREGREARRPWTAN